MYNDKDGKLVQYLQYNPLNMEFIISGFIERKSMYWARLQPPDQEGK
jgi:hypothetical protein